MVKNKAKVLKTFNKVKTILEQKKTTKGPFDDRSKSLSRSFAKMILECMKEYPEDRPTAQELREWKCVNGLIEQLEFWDLAREAIAQEPEPSPS